MVGRSRAGSRTVPEANGRLDPWSLTGDDACFQLLHSRCAAARSKRGAICIFSQYSSHRSFDHRSTSPSLSLSLCCSSLNNDFCFACTCCRFSRLWKLLSRDSFRRSGNYLPFDWTSANVVNYVDCIDHFPVLSLSFFLICVRFVLSGWISLSLSFFFPANDSSYSTIFRNFSVGFWDFLRKRY